MTVAPKSAATRLAVPTHISCRAHWRMLGTTALVTPLLFAASPVFAQVMPSNGHVVAGSATIGTASGGHLGIDQTSTKAIIEWDAFSIGANGSVHFNNGSGATLNRVKGKSVSSLDGLMTATGSVYLINPNGVIIGKEGVVDVGGSFIGSTLDMSNAAFLAGGDISLSGASQGSVINFGRIGALGGDVVLAAMNVENHGKVSAGGTAGLVAGSRLVLADQADNDGRFKVMVGGAGSNVVNHGVIEAATAELRANGGNIYALAGDTRGIIKARGVTSVDGKVFLTAGRGGTIDVANTDISARTSIGAGGTILVGTAETARTKIGAGTLLDASATNGAGGFVETSAKDVKIADGVTVTTLGKGGATGTWLIDPKDFIIASSGGDMTGTALSAALGASNVQIQSLNGATDGNGDVIVNADIAWNANTTLTLAAERDIVINKNITATGFGAGLVLDHGAGRDYRINLDNSAKITLSGANATLNIEGQNYTLIHNINQLQDIDLNLDGHYALAGAIDASDTVNWNGGAGFNPLGDGTNSFNGVLAGLGNSINGLTIKLDDTVDGKAVGLIANLSGSIRDALMLSGSFRGYELVGAFAGFGSGTLSNVRSNSTVSGIKHVGGLMGQSTGAIRQAQALAGASVSGQLNVGGILGVGGEASKTFSLYDVKSYATVTSHATSQELTGENVGGVLGIGMNGNIDKAEAYGVVTGTMRIGGLIGRSEQSVVQNSSTDNVVSTSNGGDNIGGLIGFTIAGTVSYSHADGSVSGGKATGGLIGHTLGTMISNVTSTADVTGARGIGIGVGGLIGVLWGGTLTDSTATGGLVQGWIDYGGLVGTNRGTILNSSSNNRVRAFNLGIDNDLDDFAAGGLVGTNYGVIRNSSSSSTVDARTGVGGLVGLNFGRGNEYGEIYDSSASGNVTATRGNVGGLVGTNSGILSKTSATGMVSGESRAGGLAGANDGVNAVISDSWASGNVSVPTGGNGALQGYEAGGLVGNNYGGASISRSYATGNVQGSNAIGGLVGRNLGSQITDAYATGHVEGDFWIGGFAGVNSGLLSDVFASGNVQGNEVVGGLVGDNSQPVGVLTPVLVRRAYASGAVSGSHLVGGLVGANYAGIMLAYATGSVTLSGGVNGIAGGLVGENSGTIDFTYSTGTVVSPGEGILGGLVGRNSTDTGSIGIVQNSYWNTTTSGQAISSGGVGKTNAEMHQQSTFAGWDFAGTWATVDATYMPMLYGVSGVVGLNIGTVSRLYGDDNSVLGSSPVAYIGDGFWNTVAGSPIFTSPADARSNVGSYGVSGSGVSGTRAQGGASRIVYTGTLKVTPRALTITADNKSRAYGDANPTLTYTTSGLVNGDILTGALATAASATSNVGSYDITQGGLNAGGNYEVTFNKGILQITPRALTIAADNKSRAYGDANPALTYTTNGLVNGDTLTGALTTAASATSNVGSYDITQGGLSAGGNYDVTFNKGILQVTPRSLIVTANNQSRVYGDANPALTYATSGLVNGDTLTGNLATAANAQSSVGTYAITQGGLTAGGNYAITYVGNNLQVTPRSLIVTADNKSRTYGDANPTLTYTTTGLVNGDTLTGALTTAASATSNVGSYDITQGGLSVGGNYEVTFNKGVLQVTPRSLIVTADNKSRTYGDANPALTYAVSGSGLVNGDTLTGSLATAANAQSNVGTYAITQGGLTAGGNYAITYVGNNLQVTARALTITADNKSRAYGDANPALTYTTSGLVNGDTLSGALATAASATSNIGSYDITQGGLSAGGNYAVTFNKGILQVTPRALIVTANNQSRTYGDANPALTYTVSGGGLVNGDTLSGALATAASATSNVGSYDITQGGLSAGSNYDVTFNKGILQVTPRSLIVTADNKSRTYGDANPALTYTTNGLVNGDTVSGTLATIANAASNVGNYDITQGGLSAGSNYEVTFNKGTLQVTARSLIVTADSKSRAYGDANPALTYTTNGLVNGDTLTGSLATAANAQSNVGTYAITQGGLTAGGNYTIVYVGNNLQVTPRALIVTADNKSRIYGDANPALTYTASGLVNGDTLSGSLTTAATTTSNVGNYDITQGGLNAGGNYAVTFNKGILQVTPRSLIVTADNKSRSYGDANPALTYTTNGLVNGDTLSGALATAVTATSNVGSYDITQGGLSASSNYAVTFNKGILQVTPRGVIVTADNKSRIYGDANPALTYTASGLVNGDTFSGALATAAATTSNVGSYDITLGGLTAGGNYAVTFNKGTLQITPRSLTVTANNQSRTYGDANPVLSYIASGLVNGDTLSGALATAASATSNVGSYDITQGGLNAGGNYQVTFNKGTLQITPRNLIVTANNQSRVYGDANPALSYTASGLVNGDTLSGALTTAASATSNAGSYDITQGGLTAGGNYAVTFNKGTLQITPRAITVAALGGTSTYGDAPANPGLSAQGLVNGDDVDDLTGLYNSFGITSTSGVGNYTMTVGGALTNANYVVSSTTTGTWVITRRGILVTVVADDFTRKYGEANPVFTYTATGLQGTDQLTGELATAATQYSNVGQYSITQGSLSAGENYSIEFTPGTLNIVARDLYVAADYKSRVYGDDNPLLTYAVTGDGFVAGQGFTGALATGADRQSRVGYYDIEQGSLSAGRNYTIHFTGNQLQITPRTLIVTANNLSRIYGDANPALTYKAEGLVNGDQLTGALFTEANARSAVHDYAITQGGLSAGGNYAMTFNAGTLTITPRALTVTAANQSRQYGDANPALGYSTNGLVNGDTLTGTLSTTATTTSNVGNYAITQGDLAASSNYVLTFKDGNLQVVPRALIVKADNKTREYNQANPELTYTVQGLVNGDTMVSGGLTTAATETSKVGTYAITNNGLSAGSNYEIRFTAGTLKVVRAATGSGGDDMSDIYDGSVLEKHIPAAETNGVSVIRFTPDCSADNETLSVYPANLPAQSAPCPLTVS